jgi:hypothetical protein
VQRGILRAFILAPERTTRELMEWTHTLALYRGRRSRWQRHDYAKSVSGLRIRLRCALADAGRTASYGGPGNDSPAGSAAALRGILAR